MWRDHETGSIGASFGSRFTKVNPIFSFLTSGADSGHQDTKRFFVFSDIPESLCREDSLLIRIPVCREIPHHWTITRTAKFGDNFYFSGKPRNLIIDSGAGVIAFPKSMYSSFMNHLVSLKIPSMQFTTIPGWFHQDVLVDYQHVHMIPPVSVSLLDSSGKSVVLLIPSRTLVTCYIHNKKCRLFLIPLPISADFFIIDLPLFRSFNIGFDSIGETVNFCEPSLSKIVPPLIQVSPGPHRQPQHQSSPATHLYSASTVVEESLIDQPFVVPRLSQNVVDDDEQEEELVEEETSKLEKSSHQYFFQRIYLLTLFAVIIII